MGASGRGLLMTDCINRGCASGVRLSAVAQPPLLAAVAQPPASTAVVSPFLH